MKKLWKSRKFKIIAGIVLGVMVLLAGAFGVYVSDFYHAEEGFDTGEVAISDYGKYTVYGDVHADTGLIFYPGGKVEAKAYEPLMCSLAEKGVCAVLVEMPFRLAVFDQNAANSVISDITTVNRWVIAGHSLGGVMAANYAASHEDTISGVVLLAAYPTKTIESTPVLSIVGSDDGVLKMDKYQAGITKAQNLQEMTLQGGNHAYYGNYGEQKGDGTAQITKEQQWLLTTSAITDFIDRTK